MNVVALYRYPHPLTSDKWLYVGQGAKRDVDHRSGRSSFGRRFRKLFPDASLPQPVRWTEPAADSIEANNAETVAMFRYHTWHGYPGGMNLTLPGSDNYQDIGRLAARLHKERGTGIWGFTHEQRVRAGRISKETRSGVNGFTHEQHVEAGRRAGSVSGRNNRDRGIGIFKLTRDQLSNNGKKGGITGGSVQGRKNVESGHMLKVWGAAARSRLAEPLGFRASILRMARCKHWNIDRGKPCTCGRHQTSPFAPNRVVMSF